MPRPHVHVHTALDRVEASLVHRRARRSHAHAPQRLASKWVDFLERHGTEYGWDESVGPTLELTKHFQTWGFFNRTNFSTVGLDGMGDSWGQLAVQKAPVAITRHQHTQQV